MKNAAEFWLRRPKIKEYIKKVVSEPFPAKNYNRSQLGTRVRGFQIPRLTTINSRSIFPNCFSIPIGFADIESSDIPKVINPLSIKLNEIFPPFSFKVGNKKGFEKFRIDEGAKASVFLAMVVACSGIFET